LSSGLEIRGTLGPGIAPDAPGTPIRSSLAPDRMQTNVHRDVEMNRLPHACPD
jgi:hypothetical protein